jgi:hypothetical protein
MAELKRQNVTVSLSVQTVQKAKLLAARRSTSISALLADQVESMVAEEETYERARRSAMSRLKSGFHLGGGKSATRDELYER